MSEFSESRLTFHQLLARFARVEIPIIQRDYAQGRASAEDVRSGLLDAMVGALEKEVGDPNLPLDLDFVYGSIVEEKQIHGDGPAQRIFSPLDGQQRLTTLFLLHWFGAWIDGKGDIFREDYGKGEKSRFSYLVRPSSTEFFDALSNYFPEQGHLKGGRLSKHLEEEPWFFLYWKQDPTIQSALTMLDSIHGKFGTQTGIFTKLRDTDAPRITFQLLELKQFGLSDDLYIKMNARGKPLTVFENFKAKMEQHLAIAFPGWTEKAENGPLPVKDYFSCKIETAWADLFWNYGDKKTHLFDEQIMSLYRALAIITRDPDDSKFEETWHELRNQKSQLTFQRCIKLDCVDKSVVRTFIAVLDQLSGQAGGIRTYLSNTIYLNEASLFERAINPNVFLNYDEYVEFHGYTGYLAQHRDQVDPDRFWNWGRVISNLARNTIYNRPEDLQRSLRSLNGLFENADRILEFLSAEAPSIFGFNEQQVREEQLKAQLILKSDEWKKLILKAESHGYFAGQIEFLFKFSGVLERWVDTRTVDWSDEEDADFRRDFDSYYEKANRIFNAQGLREFEAFLWERALLSMGDYLIESGRNYCFLKSEGRETSWKRLLRGNPKKLQDEERRDIVLKVLIRLDLDANAANSLREIVETADIDSNWRRLLVENPEAIEYCENRLIRWISEEEVYLLKRSQLNGLHSDLFSYCLYFQQVRSLIEDGILKPLTSCDYWSMTDTLMEPRIFLSGSTGEGKVDVWVFNPSGEEAMYELKVSWGKSESSEKLRSSLEMSGFLSNDRSDGNINATKRITRDFAVTELRNLVEILAVLGSASKSNG